VKEREKTRQFLISDWVTGKEAPGWRQSHLQKGHSSC